MRVLVTGATGFTGGHLARALAARGHTVRALVRGKEIPGGSSLTLVQGDLRDPAALAEATNGVDVVYNIAAVYRQAGLAMVAGKGLGAAAATIALHSRAMDGPLRVGRRIKLLNATIVPGRRRRRRAVTFSPA